MAGKKQTQKKAEVDTEDMGQPTEACIKILKEAEQIRKDLDGLFVRAALLFTGDRDPIDVLALKEVFAELEKGHKANFAWIKQK